MKNPNFLVQILPVLTIILFIVCFVIYKVLARIKNQAQGNPDGGRLAEFKLATAQSMPEIERLKIECPAIIERPQGLTKVGIKEITINGAFVTCPKPFPVGESFQIKIIFENDQPLLLNADVLWNNTNVPQDQIVARGMKVRFLQITEDERQILNELVSNPSKLN
jgi:hypothetical protein